MGLASKLIRIIFNCILDPPTITPPCHFRNITTLISTKGTQMSYFVDTWVYLCIKWGISQLFSHTYLLVAFPPHHLVLKTYMVLKMFNFVNDGSAYLKVPPSFLFVLFVRRYMEGLEA